MSKYRDPNNPPPKQLVRKLDGIIDKLEKFQEDAWEDLTKEEAQLVFNALEQLRKIKLR